jgi:hypothetical protein
VFTAATPVTRREGIAAAAGENNGVAHRPDSGKHSVHPRVLELSKDLPAVVEVVDTAEKINSLLPFLDESVQEGMITIESVRVLKYRANGTSAEESQ